MVASFLSTREIGQTENPNKKLCPSFEVKLKTERCQLARLRIHTLNPNGDNDLEVEVFVLRIIIKPSQRATGWR